MRGIVVPERTEDFSADPVELFFDLAFVFAFSQIVHMLVVHPDGRHVAEAGMIFLLLWLPWTQFAWAANAVPGNQRSVRLAFLVATGASVPMAAAVETAFDDGGLLFTVPLAVIYLMGLAVMVAGIETGSDEYRSVVRYFRPNFAAMALLVVGALLEGPARVVAWVVTILVVVWATIRAGDGVWIIRRGHFAERHGLIIIVALGEVIVALGRAVVEPMAAGEGFSGEAVVALVATGAAAGLLWWSYFDRVQPALEHRMEDLSGSGLGRFVRDTYTYDHAPIVAGLILVAVGLEEAALHPAEPLDLAFRSMLWGGLALFVVGITLAIHRSFGVFPPERLGVVVAMGAFLLLAGSLDAVWLIVILDVVAVVGLAAEHYRIEKRPGDPAIHVAHD